MSASSWLSLECAASVIGDIKMSKMEKICHCYADSEYGRAEVSRLSIVIGLEDSDFPEGLKLI